MVTFPHLFVLTCYLHIRWNASIIYLVLNVDSGLSMLPWVMSLQFCLKNTWHIWLLKVIRNIYKSELNGEQ